MRLFIPLIMLIVSPFTQADTIQSYMKIANNIPKNELKADSKSQALARSARNVMYLTHESIAETILEANDIAKKNGKPLFCLPPEAQLNAETLEAIIKQQAATVMDNLPRDKRVSVSSVAWQGVLKTFPCHGNQTRANRMAHVSTILNR